MPLYSYRCSLGHESDHYFKFSEKRKSVRCDSCGKRALSIINTQMIGSCWPEGRVFPHVQDAPVKNYKELDKVIAANGGYVENLSPKAMKAKQEERKHNTLRSAVRKKDSSYKTPDVVKRSLHHRNLETGMRMLSDATEV